MDSVPFAKAVSKPVILDGILLPPAYSAKSIYGGTRLNW